MVTALKRSLLSLMVVMLTSAALAEVDASDSTLEALYSKAHQARIETLSMDKKLDFFARIFLARKSPYVSDPLGEGDNGRFNQGPLYRFDGFDCTTFVETVMALALSQNSHQFKDKINQIRYKQGEISYETRNHFPSTDWIPNNTASGFVKDITGQIAGTSTKWSQTWIEKDRWIAMKGVDYQQISKNFTKELGRLPYISKHDLLARPDLLLRIPSGAIFHVVRPNWDLKKAIGTQLDVSHEGFAIWEGGQLYLVHASNGLRDGSNDYKGVKKELLTEYVNRVMIPSSSMAGLNFVQVLSK